MSFIIAALNILLFRAGNNSRLPQNVLSICESCLDRLFALYLQRYAISGVAYKSSYIMPGCLTICC